MNSKHPFLPPILWALFIFIASSNPDPTGFLPEGTIKAMRGIRILGCRMDNLTWAVSHVFLYAVLALLLARAFTHKRDFSSQIFWTAFAIAFIYGVSDEIHQIFVPNRGFQWYDILMDGVGALIGLGIYALHRLKRAQDVRENGLLL